MVSVVSQSMLNAIAQDNLAQVRACLNDDAFNVNDFITCDVGQVTALTYASYLGRVKIVEELLKADGIDVNLATDEQEMTPLMIACAMDRKDIVHALLRVRGINVDYCTNDTATALLLAVHLKDTVDTAEIVRALLCAGANADAVWPHEKDMTALKIAGPRAWQVLDSWRRMPVEGRAHWCEHGYWVQDNPFRTF
jgi:ankyrin repeat protein